MASQAVSDVTYLSDIDMKSSSAGWGSWAFDEDIDKGVAIELYMGEDGTKTFEKGLAVNAGRNSTSRATYDVSNYGGQTFFAFAGVHYSQLSAENSGKGATVTFEVRIDGTSVWQSDGIRKASSPAEMVMVDIPEGASELTLYVDGTEDGINYDHGIWAKACLVEDKAVLKNLESVYADAPGYFEIGQSSPMTLKGKAFDESDITFDDSVTVTCESSDDNVISVNGAGDSWILTGKNDGTASIQITVKKDGVILHLTKSILVGDGEEGSISTTSPNGDHKILFTLSETGELTYYIFSNADNQKNMVVEGAATGLQTNLGDFSTGLTLLEAETHEVTDSYDLIGAKEDHVDATGNETVMKFEKQPNEEGVYYYVIARAYDDGVAFRYQISSDTKKDLEISWEYTTIKLPSDAHSFATPFNNHNEAMEVEKENSGLSGAFCMPHLYKTGNTYCLLSEAAISQEYAGAALYGDGTGTLEIRVSEGDNRPTKVVKTSTSVLDPWAEEGEEHPWVSPWRFLVMGDLNTIHGTTMPETLSPDCVLDDTSWIEDGTCSWTWLNGEGTRSFETYKRYVDMTAAMGWKYLLLDEGWQPGSSEPGYRYKGYYDWFPDLIEYANEKNVGLIVWAWYDDLWGEDKMEVLQEWADMGVKGIKPDFFDSNSQEFMEFFLQLYQKTAECHLLMNAHGAPKTTGERRTFPNLLTREGIYGAEMGGGPTAHHTCTLPFTRNAVGPADYTPLLSIYRNGTAYHNYTTGHNSALPIIFESGITCMADRDSVYLNSVTRPLYQNLPSGWIDTEVLEGDVGQYATIMRESDDSRYYIGTICDEARTTDISLDFLPDGDQYHAYIVEDGEEEDELTLRHQTVTKSDRLELPLVKTGGALIMIVKDPLIAPETLTLDQYEVDMTSGENIQLTAALTPEDTQLNLITWKSSDENVVTVSQGKITAVRSGIATVTAVCGDLTASCKVKVYPGEYEKSDRWEIVREAADNWKVNQENSLTLTTADKGGLLRNKDNTRNEFFIDADNDFEVSVKLDFKPSSNFQSAGILAMGSNGAYTALWRRYHSYFNGNLLNMVTWNPNKSDVSEIGKKYESSAEVQKSVWLKMVKDGDTVNCYYHYEGEEWTLLYSEDNPVLNKADSIRVGVYMGDDQSGGNTLTADFADFTYKAKDGEEENIPFGKKTEREVMALEMTQKGKTSYLTGEEFDALDYRFIAYYTDRTEEEISGEDCQVTGFDTNKGGKQEVTFEYGGKTASVTVDLIEVGLTEDEVIMKLLEEAYAAYAELDLTAYTEKSSAALTEALADARKVLDGGEVENKTVQDVLEALMQAEAALEVDMTGLKEDVEAARIAAAAAQAAADAAKETADQAKKDAETAALKADEAKETAEAAQKAAENVVSQAGADKEAVEKAKQEAEIAKTAAETAEKNAAAAEAQANEAVKAAAEAQNKAETAKTAAEAAKEAAENAKNDAESAKTLAEAAKEEAEAARNEAQSARDAASTAQKAAESAKESAVSQAELADTARAAAEAAKEAAEAAKLAAEKAQAEAEEILKKAQAEAEAELAKAEEARKKVQAEADEKLAKAEALLKEAREVQDQTKNYVLKETFKAQKVTVTDAKSKKKKTAKITWEKVDGAEGYVVEYALKASFKGSKAVMIKKGTTVSKTLKKLKSKKTYYIRVKAYKTINGEKIYTGIGAKKKVRVK